jgi:hypothetical protein
MECGKASRGDPTPFSYPLGERIIVPPAEDSPEKSVVLPVSFCNEFSAEISYSSVRESGTLLFLGRAKGRVLVLHNTAHESEARPTAFKEG